MEEKIMTLHPQRKKGVNILKRRYDIVKETLLNIMKKNGELEFNKLTELAHNKLKDRFDGKITWYVVTVKLDLEARGIIKRVKNSSPQILKLSE